MIKKKKKKANLSAQQKQQAVYLKKQYMGRLRNMCALIGNGEPLFDLLPQYILDAIYANRGVTLKIRVADNVKITKRFVRIMYCHLDKMMKDNSIDLMTPNVTEQVSLTDYYQIIFPLETILRTPIHQFAGKEKFNDFCVKFEERFHKYIEGLTSILIGACFMYSDLSKRSLYTYKYEIHRTEIAPNQYFGLLYQTVIINVHLVGMRYADIRGDRRPVIQAGEMDHASETPVFIPTTISLKRLHEKDPSGKKTVPVYIQQHAIDRTMQRACCFVPGAVQMLITDAFNDNSGRIINEGDRYLVECYFYEIKIGYFVGILVDEIFVILTFLFIIHNGTPEGRKLTRLTGLQRDDMTFLAIDDLKTLINSDITRDPRITGIFIDAGCESILQMNYELHAQGGYYWLKDETKQDTELSKLITEYIRLGDSDKEYFENE
ncbi:MAG: hypothetical protein LBH60_08815 [Prevotellaceae bacterium]|jgi:hypothetical protein|nr:hypothetical protein [Prevotellaceae bacterium]